MLKQPRQSAERSGARSGRQTLWAPLFRKRRGPLAKQFQRIAESGRMLRPGEFSSSTTTSPPKSEDTYGESSPTMIRPQLWIWSEKRFGENFFPTRLRWLRPHQPWGTWENRAAGPGNQSEGTGRAAAYEALSQLDVANEGEVDISTLVEFMDQSTKSVDQVGPLTKWHHQKRRPSSVAQQSSLLLRLRRSQKQEVTGSCLQGQ